MWRERGRVQNAGRNKDDCFIGQFVFMCMDRLENRAGECAAPSAGRNGSRIIAFVCTGRIRFYLMTGMSVGIALLLYSLVTHESIGYGDGCLFVMTGLFLGIWENLVLLLLASVLAGIGSAVLLFLEKEEKGKNTVCTICIYGVCFIVTLMEGAGYAGKFFNRGIIDRATCACGHGTCAENRNRLL